VRKAQRRVIRRLRFPSSTFMDGAEIQRLLDPGDTDLVALYEDFARSLIAELELGAASDKAE
jgi:hypothetical protein